MRGSYGTTGNQNFTPYTFSGVITNGYDYVIGDASNQSLAIGSIQSEYSNQNVKWETTRQYNIGVDLALFNNKFTLAAEYYSTDKKDMLFPVTLPGSTGATKTLVMNVGNTVSYTHLDVYKRQILKLSYVINNEGDIQVTQKLLTEKGKKVPNMFRYGMRMRMPKEMYYSHFYGRGPVENYIDRNHNSFVGIYKMTTQEQFYPYIRPQENGCKTDIRWWNQTNKGGIGLNFVASKPFSMVALNYTIESLDDGDLKDQRHSGQVEPADFIEVCIDYAQQGLGGENSWGSTCLPQYRLTYKDYEFTYQIKPLDTVY